jgi:hypothetical protein
MFKAARLVSIMKERIPFQHNFLSMLLNNLLKRPPIETIVDAIAKFQIATSLQRYMLLPKLPALFLSKTEMVNQEVRG